MSSENLTPHLESVVDQEPATVSVIIVVWNAKRYVIECLESLKEHCAAVKSEVIVVDNASTDGTPELVERRFPEFKLIRNSENLGFARANNIGMLRSTGDYICLVNSDVKFTSDCFTPMLAYFADHPEASLLGPRSLWPSGEVRRSTMRFPTVWNQFCRALGLDVAFKESRVFGGLLMSDFDHLSTIQVEVLVGWFLIARRRAVERVGLFDPRFFIYGEDVDWCYRFRQAGEKVVFFTDAEAIHYGGASSSNAPLRFTLEHWSANWQYWRKHRGLLGQACFLANSLVYNGLRFIAAAVAWVFVPGTRERNARKFKTSWTCLQWALNPRRSPLDLS